MSNTIRAKFPIKRRDAAPVVEKVVEKLRPAPQRPSPRVSHVARQLALAHYIERLIEASELDDYATAARDLGLTRARLTQVMNLLLLAPEVQERVLLGDSGVTGRALRRVVGKANWDDQFAMCAIPSRDVGS